jgi:biopolymer transport protein ExbB/TolQ
MIALPQERRISVNPMEILSRIVEAESNARTVFDEAASLQDGFDAYVEAHVEALRKQYFAHADQVIAEAEERESARADAEIAALDRKLENELAGLKALYETRRGVLVARIFRIAVAADA